MGHKNRNDPKIATSAQIIAVLKAMFDRLDKTDNYRWLKDQALSQADKLQDHFDKAEKHKTSESLKRYSQDISLYETLADQAMESGDAEKAAFYAFKLGANAASLEIWDSIATAEWLTVSETAEILAVRVNTVSDYVENGVLRSNGRTEKDQRLIDPASVCRHFLRDLRKAAKP